MSMCDVCLSPGHCCKKIFLSGGPPDPVTGARIGDAMSYEQAEHQAMRQGLPFVPSEQIDGRWRYTCPALQSDGRCGIYATRPDLCRRYLPGEDPLCVHHWKLEVT